MVLDQTTKAIVRATLPLHESMTVIPGFFDFTHVRNTGAAFGMLNSVDFPGKTLLLSLIAAGALIGIAMYSLALALTSVGGSARPGAGERRCRGKPHRSALMGSVVDFIDVYWRSLALLDLQRCGLGDHRRRGRS